MFVSLPGLTQSRGERRLWATHLPACLRPWESRDRNLARPSWSAQQQPRQVPRAARLTGEFWRYRPPGMPSLHSGSHKADQDLGRATAQLQPQHKLTLAATLILQRRPEDVRTRVDVFHSFLCLFLHKVFSKQLRTLKVSVCKLTAVNKTTCLPGACSLILETGSAFLLLLLLAVLGVHCCAGFALVAVSGGYTPVALQGFLVAVASLVVEHHSRSWGLSSCGLWALSTGSVVVAHRLSCSMAC